MEVKILDTGPEPVLLEELREFCKINAGDDDFVLQIMNKAARQICQRYLNRSLSLQRIQAYTTGTRLVLPYWPVIEIEEVQAGDDMAYNYEMSGNEQIVVTASAGPIKVTYKAGYGVCASGEACPDDMLMAVMMTVRYWYDLGYVDGKLPEEAKKMMDLSTDNLFL